jgi:hypothetical protein
MCLFNDIRFIHDMYIRWLTLYVILNSPEATIITSQRRKKSKKERKRTNLNHDVSIEKSARYLHGSVSYSMKNQRWATCSYSCSKNSTRSTT